MTTTFNNNYYDNGTRMNQVKLTILTVL